MRCDGEIWGTMRADDDHLFEALGPREVIGRAVDLLCAEHEVSEAEAFEMLVRGSSDSHETVRENAAAVLRRSADKPDTRLPSGAD